MLATLDSDTVTDLRHAEALAEFKVEDTQDKLDNVLGLQSDDPLVRARAENALAQAENALAQAEVALENAEDALDDYQLEHDVALSAAVQRVADATAALDRAEEAVTRLRRCPRTAVRQRPGCPRPGSHHAGRRPGRRIRFLARP